jgi:hypothetical protein
MNGRLDAQLDFCKEHALKAQRACIGGKFAGVTYLMRAGEFIKVGVARDVEKRVDLLQIGCSFTIEVLRAYPYRLERLLIWYLRPHRVRGEW